MLVSILAIRLAQIGKIVWISKYDGSHSSRIRVAPDIRPEKLFQQIKVEQQIKGDGALGCGGARSQFKSLDVAFWAAGMFFKIFFDLKKI